MGLEPTTSALLERRSNQLSYMTYLIKQYNDSYIALLYYYAFGNIV